MTTTQLLQKLTTNGIRLARQDDRLIVDAPRGAITSELRQLLVERKPELMDMIGAVHTSTCLTGTTARDDTKYFFELAADFRHNAESIQTTNPEAADEWRLYALRNRVFAGADVRVEDLPSDWRIEWEDIAAQLEHNQGLLRERAEAEALNRVLLHMRNAGKILS